jgi:type VI secretion system secreted protein VgrG
MSTTDVATAQPLASVETPLADDLRFLSLRASAELGRMPRCELTLVSKRADIDFSKILGKHVKVSLRVDGAKPRVFGGYVVSFRQTGMRGRLYAYEAAVRPWLWLLTRRSTCRIFQNKTVEEIVKAVFADPVYKQLELGEIKWKANSRAHRPREYCVQYRESDFNFVSRLLEDEGIYYWFQDKDGKESLILTDTLAAHGIRERVARESHDRDAQLGAHRLRLQASVAALAKAGRQADAGLRRVFRARTFRLSRRLCRGGSRREPGEVARGRRARRGQRDR